LKFTWILVFLLFCNLYSKGQETFFDNELAIDFVRKGADMIYSMQHDSVLYYTEKTRKILPNHPVVPMMEAMHVLWKHIPVLEDSIFERFQFKLMEAVARSQDLDEEHPEAIRKGSVS
jgi:hypothetical protein